MGPPSGRLAWAGSAAVLLACSGDTAESPYTGDSQDAPPATITLERAFSLGSIQDPLTPDLESTFAVTDSFLVVSALRGIVHVFSRDGDFLREMDRRGDGPGEFAGTVIPVPEGGDRMTLLDRVTGRYLSVDWRRTRSSRRGRWRVEPGEIVSPVPPVFAWVDGRVVLSPGQWYSLAAVDDGAEGGVRVIREDPDFFDREWRATPTAPVFRAQVRRLAPGPEGSLWVVSLIPRSDAGNAVRDIFTTWVELIDIESGEVLARTQVPGVASLTQDGAWLYRFGENRGVAPSVHFHRLRVEDAEG